MHLQNSATWNTLFNCSTIILIIFYPKKKFKIFVGIRYPYYDLIKFKITLESFKLRYNILKKDNFVLNHFEADTSD